MTLKIERDGTVVILAPERTPKEEINRFFRSKRGWIEKKLKEYKELPGVREKQRRYVAGEKFFYLGEEFPLEVPGQKHPSRIEIKLKPSELISPERRNVISMPQTEKELDDLSNIPAYKRRELEEKKRSMIIDDLDEVHVEKKKSSQDENLTFQDFPLSDEVSSPSFMRKQMQ